MINKHEKWLDLICNQGNANKTTVKTNKCWEDAEQIGCLVTAGECK